MKVLIADDEEIIRFSLESILQELDSEVILRFAANGRALIEEFRSFKPDLVFVDIRMPLLSGLDAIEEVSGENQDAEWVVLSGHSEFSYAKRALSLRVREYLLKPPDPLEIGRLLSEVKTKLQQNRKERRELFEQRMQGILNNTLSPEFYDDSGRTEEMAGMLICYDPARDDKEMLDGQRQLSRKIREILATRVQGVWALLGVSDGSSLLVGTGKSAVSGQHEVRQEIKRISTDLSVQLIECEASVGPTKFFEGMRNLQAVIPLRYLFSKHESIEAEKLYRVSRAPDGEMLLRLCSRLETLLLQMDELEPDEFFHRFAELHSLWESQFALLAPYQTAFLDNLRRILNDESLCILGGETLKSIQRIYHGSLRRNGATELVSKAEGIVRRRFGESIGVAQVAEELGVSPNYLSARFKQGKGISFTAFITEIRLKEATRLLSDPGRSVKSVSAQLGYLSSRHFTRIFKERYKISPSEYQSRYGIR